MSAPSHHRSRSGKVLGKLILSLVLFVLLFETVPRFVRVPGLEPEALAPEYVTSESAKKFEPHPYLIMTPKPGAWNVGADGEKTHSASGFRGAEIPLAKPEGGLRFNLTPPRAVVFRGTVEVSGLDGPAGRPAGRRWFHLVQRQGEKGPSLGRISLAPGQQRQVRVRLIYPADATPPQVLSLLPAPVLPQAAVKQSGSVPAPRP